MVFARLMLVSAVMISLDLVHVTNMLPADETYKTKDIALISEKSTMAVDGNVGLSDGNDRESNLRYVMVIQHSKIWAAIKNRSLTTSNQKHDSSLLDKSPESLSDQELSQLKQVCHDGLKCVAVDQLMVLRYAEQTDGGKKSVRMAINKITKVLTAYTTEYHEKYQYVAVTDADDTKQMNNSVAIIMEDNKELCQFDTKTYAESSASSDGSSNKSADGNSNKSTDGSSNNNADGSSNKGADGSSNKNADGNSNKGVEESSNKSADSNSIKSADGSSNKNADGRSYKGADGSSKKSTKENPVRSETKDGPLTVVNHGNINFGTVNNYNINEGTVTSATVNIEPLKSTPPSEPSKEGNPQTTSVHADREPEKLGTEEKNADQIKGEQNKGTGDTSARDKNVSDNKIRVIIGSIDDSTNPSRNTSTVNNNDSTPKTDSAPVKTVSPSETDSAPVETVSPGETDSAPVETDSPGETDSVPVETVSPGENADLTNTGSSTVAGPTANTDGTDDNFLLTSNGQNSILGTNNSFVDIASTGTDSKSSVKKGFVNDGNLNNGTMNTNNINTGTINKGTITGCNAEGGIISVGTVNNGDSNYGSIDSFRNDGAILKTDSTQVKRFAVAINNIYTDIYEHFNRKMAELNK